MANPTFTDWSLQQENIKRQRALADALREQASAQTPTQYAGGFAVPNSPLSGLAQLGKGWIAGKMTEKADKDSQDLVTNRQKALADTLKGYTDALQGTPAQMAPSMALKPNEDGTPQQVETQAAVGPDRNRAIALLLQNPDTAPMALQAQLKNLEPAKYSTTPHYDQSGKAFILNERGELKNLEGVSARDKMELAPSGQAYNPYALKPGQVLADPNKPFTIGADGQPVANTGYQNYEIGKAQAGASRNTLINNGPKAFETELGKLDAEKLGEFRKSAELGKAAIATAQNLRSAVKQGVYSGGGANAKAEAANLISGITGVPMKNLPGTQLFNAEASGLVLNSVKALGANPSNADRDFIEKTVPNIAHDPKARDALIDFMEKKAKQSIDVYQRADTHARKNHGLGGFDYLSPDTSTDDEGWGIRKK